jgi:catechol-2,3-dioxygenase
LEVDKESLQRMLEKGKAAGVEVRGVADHGFIHSIYFRDPNGYVIELTAKHGDHERAMDPAANGARRELDSWQREKPAPRRAARKPPRAASARRPLRAAARPARRRT